jgi:hypothetical protein
MMPPEVILDRWVKKQSRECPRFVGYLGKLDLDRVEPSSISPFLTFVQDAMNAALRLENTNASGGVQHPPYHFDYLQVKGDIRNAHAFQHEGFSFIVVTLPLVRLLWDLSLCVSRSAPVQQLLRIHPSNVRLDALQALIFQFQLLFLISHEYTHHVHQHCGGQTPGVWTEFFEKDVGGLDLQAQELDADGYSIYLVLANFVRGGGRLGALLQVQKQDSSTDEADELLVLGFFIALMSLFCALWPEEARMESIQELRHPPTPVRIEYAIRIAKMWCAQNHSLPESWFSAERFNALFRAATECVHGSSPRAWDSHIVFLQSAAGAEYERLLFERFEAGRRDAESTIIATA